jgi:pSer/pThr/pTyr-binding forkhead associated (FHA) protein
MEASAHYRHLWTLGRDEFLAAAAPAALVRYGSSQSRAGSLGMTTQTLEQDLLQKPQEPDERVDGARLHGTVTAEATAMEIYPLAKKPGASFRDRITIGRTSNNDVVIVDHSVSRLHGYVRQGERWLFADAGSKNGSWLDDQGLEPRREAPLSTGAVLRLGDVVARFYPAAHLFDLLGGDHGRR